MRYFETIVKALLILLLVGLIVVVLIQVFARFLLPRTPSWTEELARFIMLFLVAIGSGLTYKQGLFINIDILHKLKNKPKGYYRLLSIAVNGITAATMLVLLIHSFPMIKVGIKQTSPALFIPMAILFSTMAIVPINILLAQIHQAYSYFKSRKQC